MLAFNGEMLRLAREFRGYSQRDFAALLKSDASNKSDASALSRIENGLIKPNDELVEKFSQSLSLPLAFFQQTESIYGLPLSVHPMWRKKAATTQREVDKAIAGFNIKLLHMRRMLKAIEYEPVLPLPQYDIESYNGDAEKIAAMLRQLWQMPSGPVQDLTAWVERAGCFVIYDDLPDSAMAGVTMRIPDMRPCIFLNRSMPADRIRFTLAHELGHLIMHRYPTQDMENEANAFAGAFLMPRNDIRFDFQGKRIDLRLLAGLKPVWRVAMQSLLYRAKELGYVSENQEKYLWMQFNANKIRLREPPELDLTHEQPALVAKLVSLHVNDLGYSTADLTAITKMHEKETAEMYGLNMQPAKSGLRLVR